MPAVLPDLGNEGPAAGHSRERDASEYRAKSRQPPVKRIFPGLP